MTLSDLLARFDAWLASLFGHATSPAAPAAAHLPSVAGLFNAHPLAPPATTGNQWGGIGHNPDIGFINGGGPNPSPPVAPSGSVLGGTWVRPRVIGEGGVSTLGAPVLVGTVQDFGGQAPPPGVPWNSPANPSFGVSYHQVTGYAYPVAGPAPGTELQYSGGVFTGKVIDSKTGKVIQG